MSGWDNPIGTAFGYLDRLGREVVHLSDRAMDRQMRLAITGLRRSGKTVFTTALIHHLLAGNDLPFLNAAHERRLLGARVKPANGRPFPFERFELALQSDPPHWPQATEELSELRLEVRYRTTSWLGSMMSPDQTFEVDIVDYPGEWLLDLPLLRIDYAEFSRQALELARQGPRAQASARWFERLETADMADLVREFCDFLATCQFDLNLSFIQPGRLVHGFDALADAHAFCPLPPDHRFANEMSKRYARYVDEIVRPFYSEHFSTFDRQIVLVDLLTSLNCGPDHFADTQRALAGILESFAYGQNSWLRHLFAPRIEKVLFAASKADHVAANQHANLKQLLSSMIEPALRRAKFEGIQHDIVAMSSLRSTDTVRTELNGQILSCVRGRLKNEDRETVLFPGEIPSELPTRDDWESGIFRFYDFAPRPLRSGAGGQHVRLDQAIEFLIGDKLK